MFCAESLGEPVNNNLSDIRILTGNELIVQGGLEAGFSLYTGYPGSPLADFFNILYDRKSELGKRGIKVVIGNSEANAAAMASGAKQAGRDTLLAMKSMGLHVASDALSVGNFANPGEIKKDPQTGEEIFPGVVIAVGDDPWSTSTSTPADSRYLFKHLHIPFLAPSTPQELKDWIKIALTISKRSSVYQGLLLTTFMAEGGGRVSVGEEVMSLPDPIHLDPATFDLSKNVMVPPNSLLADRRMIEERFPKVKKILEELKLDQVFGDKESKIGFISSDSTFETLKQVLEEANYLNHVSLYKVAAPFPLCDGLLVPFLKQLDHLIVVEEKRGFLEGEVSELVQKFNLSVKISGKDFKAPHLRDGFPASGGLNYEIIRDKIIELFAHFKLGPFKENILKSANGLDFSLPLRLPTFCPGCPHRETLSLLKDLRKTLDREGIKLISHGDVGCYSLSFLPPFKEMHNLSAMGQGGALGAGVDLFTTNPSVVLMGDSTFFHSGITDISNSVQAGHNITYILLDNDNTAMTGHQMTPVSGIAVDGHARPRQEILPIIKNLGVNDCLEVNPSDRYFYQNILKTWVKNPGVKVIVSNKECGLTFHGRQKSQERKLFNQNEKIPVKSFYQINPMVCEDCRECVEMTGCPGLTQTSDGYGSKVMIDPQICVSDSYCTKLKACPSFERVDVFDYHPTAYQKFKSIEKYELPSPIHKKGLDDLMGGEDFRLVVTGVGGSGVTTISKILAEAAREMDGRTDLSFKFVDQKGLAQRNGRVTGHMIIHHKDNSKGPITPLHTADVVLSTDLLDGASAIPFLGEKGMLFLDGEFQTPLSIMLNYAEEGVPLTEEKLKNNLLEKLKNQVCIYSLKEICQKLLGKSVYATSAILGVAFQKGMIPFSLKNMEDAIRNSISKSEIENNLLSFNLGRRLVVDGEEKVLSDYSLTKKELDITDLLDQSLKESFVPWQYSKVYMDSVKRLREKLIKAFPEIKKDYLAQYLHDIFVYDRGANFESFMNNAYEISLIIKDEEERAIALRALAKTYWIKDEVLVAHLMIGPLKILMDKEKYSILGKSFKVVHINRPKFTLFGKNLEFDITPKDWMLKIMRHLRILRILMPSWHKKEKEINLNIRAEIMGPILKLPNGERRVSLIKLDNIKGYRQIRYDKSEKVFH